MELKKGGPKVMKGMSYEYHDEKGRRHTFSDIRAADHSYRTFLERNNLRLQDLKVYAENNDGFMPLAAYEASTGRFLGWVEMYF